MDYLNRLISSDWVIHTLLNIKLFTKYIVANIFYLFYFSIYFHNESVN